MPPSKGTGARLPRVHEEKPSCSVRKTVTSGGSAPAHTPTLARARDGRDDAGGDASRRRIDPRGDRGRAHRRPRRLIAIGAALCAWTWRISGAPLVDAARVPYHAQQILAGRGLYSELCYLYGPLAPYVIAGAFALFGVSFTTLKALNLVLLAGVVALPHAVLRRAANELAANVGCAVFL